MATTQCTIVGIFEDRATAERVAQELASEGIGRNNIQVMSSDTYMADMARGGAGLAGTPHRDASGGGISGFFTACSDPMLMKMRAGATPTPCSAGER